MANDLLTVAEACKRLRVHRNTMYELIRRGDVPALRIGRNIRIDYEELLKRNNQLTLPQDKDLVRP